MSTVLELKNIQRSYGSGSARVAVLDGAKLAIRQGEAVAIVGPSGSGKSTLLHIAGLLDKPTKGEVWIEGKLVSAADDKRKAQLRNQHFGFIYQHHHLLREFTALENVNMPAMIGGKPDSARARELLEAVKLSHRIGHYPTQLSGGEQQRVAIARALMNRPTLLLADEPTGNLDPHTAESVTDLLFRLIKKEGMAALIVTHNMTLAKRCDRILKMHEGVLSTS